MREQDRPEVDIIVMSAVESSQTVLGEILDPFCARAAGQRGITAGAMIVVAGHSGCRS